MSNLKPKFRNRFGTDSAGNSVRTVLFSFRDPTSGANPYTRLLAESIKQYDNVLFFSWTAAYLSRYSVFHVHWPEQLAIGASRARTLQRIILFHLLLTRLRLTRTPIVWTVHNVQPHEKMHPLVVTALRRFERQVQIRIVLNQATAEDPAFGMHPFKMIPHGHYLPTVAAAPDSAIVTFDDFLFFGLVRPYKNVPGLMRAFRAIDDDNLTLRIAGAAQPLSYGTVLTDDAKDDSRVRITLDFLGDDALVQLIRSSRLVVLPYNEMNNSGAALLALSVGRPILVPENHSTRELQAEFGNDWVLLYRGELTGEVLISSLALANFESVAKPLPDLSLRDWNRIAHQHHAIYSSITGHITIAKTPA